MTDTFFAVLETTPLFSEKISKLLGMLEGEAIEAPLTAAGWVWVSAWQEKVAVRTGTHRRSIRPFPSDTPGRVRAGSDVPYAARLEFGFTGKDSLGRTYHQAPTGHGRQAMDENHEAMKVAMVEALRSMIERAG